MRIRLLKIGLVTIWTSWGIATTYVVLKLSDAIAFWYLRRAMLEIMIDGTVRPLPTDDTMIIAVYLVLLLIAALCALAISTLKLPKKPGS